MQKKDEPEIKSLNVKNLQLPENVKMFNTGASMEKWCQKRPRLKSTKKENDRTDERPDEKSDEKSDGKEGEKSDGNSDGKSDGKLDEKLDGKSDEKLYDKLYGREQHRSNGKIIEVNEIKDNFSGSSVNGTPVDSPCHLGNKQIEDPFNKHSLRRGNLDDYDIDSDVEKLITQFIKQPPTTETLSINKKKERRRRRRRKRHIIFNCNKKKKEKNNNNNNKNKLKRKGIIRYSSIVKPPSPSTLEVIRVNVTSNYYSLQEQRQENSEDENNNDNKHHQDCVKVNGRFKFSFSANKTKDDPLEVQKKFQIDCKKLVLGFRKNSDKKTTT